MYKAKSNKELWAFLFNDFLLLTHAAKQFTSSGPDKLFSNKNNVQLKMYKPVGHRRTGAVAGCSEVIVTVSRSPCSSTRSW